MKRRRPGRTAILATTLVIGGIGLALVLLLATPVFGIGRNRGADGRFEKRTSSHFVLYQDVAIDDSAGLRGSRHFEQQVLAVLEDAFDAVDHGLGLRPTRPITVVVYDPAVFDLEFAGLFRFPAAGFYGGRVHVRGNTIVDARLVGVLHHELVHAAFDAVAPSLVPPAWLNEGAAEWLEARASGRRSLSPGQRALLARVAASGGLPSLAELSGVSFARLGAERAQIAYLQSHAFVDFLARIQGDGGLSSLIDSFRRTGDVERALRRTFRADLARLEARQHQEVSGWGR